MLGYNAKWTWWNLKLYEYYNFFVPTLKKFHNKDNNYIKIQIHAYNLIKI